MKIMDLGLITAVGIVAFGALTAADTAFGAGMTVAQATTQTSQASGDRAARPSTTLAQAVRAAEARTKGRAGKVELERESGRYVYEVETFSKDGTAEVTIDFVTGKIEDVETDGLLAKVGNIFDGDDKRKDEARLKVLEAASVTLSAAIDAAETSTGGRAVEAKLKDRYGVAYYSVALIVDGSKHRVMVDGSTAKVSAVKARKKDDDDDND